MEYELLYDRVFNWIKQTLCAAEIESKLNCELTNHQWQLVEKLVQVLKRPQCYSSKQWKITSCSCDHGEFISTSRNTSTEEDEGVQTMKRKKLLSLNNCYTTKETNKLCALLARQCLTEEFSYHFSQQLLKQLFRIMTLQLPKASQRCR